MVDAEIRPGMGEKPAGDEVGGLGIGYKTIAHVLVCCDLRGYSSNNNRGRI